MLYPLIGITGRKGSGKDTAVSLFATEGPLRGFRLCGKSYQHRAILKFASPLKLMLRAHMEYCGLDNEYIRRVTDGDLKEIKNPAFNGRTTRWAMQSLGTEWGRQQIDDELWLSAFEQRYNHVRSDKQCGVVCTDMRFENELKLIDRLGGVTIKIVNPDFVQEGPVHSSEAAIDGMKTDLTFINDRNKFTSDEFAAHVAQILIQKGIIN